MLEDHELPALRIRTTAEVPDVIPLVAKRIWAAWWRDDGYPLQAIAERLAESLRPDAVPTTLVASRGADFAGTVSLIECDMEERPEYSPWLAALWVEPAHRRQGVAEALMESVLALAAAAGIGTVYLCATPDNTPYYAKRGWRSVEQDVAGMDILCRSSPGFPPHT